MDCFSRERKPKLQRIIIITHSILIFYHKHWEIRKHIAEVAERQLYEWHSANTCSGGIHCANVLWAAESHYAFQSNIGLCCTLRGRASLAPVKCFFLKDDITHSRDDCEHFCQIHVRPYFTAGFKAECVRRLWIISVFAIWKSQIKSIIITDWFGYKHIYVQLLNLLTCYSTK